MINDFKKRVAEIMAIPLNLHEDGIPCRYRAIESLLRECNWIAACVQCGEEYETFTKQNHLMETYPDLGHYIGWSMGNFAHSKSIGDDSHQYCGYCAYKIERYTDENF